MELSGKIAAVWFPHWDRRVLAVLCVAAGFSAACLGATAQNQRVSKSPTPTNTCSPPAPASSFSTTDGHAYLYFEATVASTDKVSAVWYGPTGAVVTSQSWNSVSGTYCFLGAQFDFSTFTPLNGPYHVDVLANQSLLFSLPFTLAGPAPTGGTGANGPPQISAFARSQVTPGNIDVTVYGGNFASGATVAVDYVLNGAVQWNVARGLNTTVSNSGQLSVHLYLQDPGEFQLTVQNPNGQTSNPKILFVGLSGYKLPYPAGERWTTTQGNNESGNGYDHNGRLAYAYDFSAGSGHCVSAMKAGIVHTHDNGLGQLSTDPTSPGNYITIDHLNGEYSYYFHLKTGTFVVAEGQYVEQGQSLATVGNSGYTLPAGFGYHVHVEVTKSATLPAQSVPFLFDDVGSDNPAGSPPGQPVRPNPYTSQNTSGFGTCAAGHDALQFGVDGVVAFGNWWSANFTVPANQGTLRINLTWPGSANLVLYARSPSGHAYGYGSDTLGDPGYYQKNPQTFTVTPEAGTWTVWVLGWIVPNGTQNFTVTATN